MWSVAYIAAQFAHFAHRIRSRLLEQINRFGFVPCVCLVAAASALFGLVSHRLLLFFLFGLPMFAFILEGLASLSSRPQDFRPLSAHVPKEKEIYDAMKLFGLASSPVLGLLVANDVGGRLGWGE